MRRTGILLAVAAGLTASMVGLPIAQAAVNPHSTILTLSCGIKDAKKAPAKTACNWLPNGDVGTHLYVEFYSGGVLLFTENDPLNLDADVNGPTGTYEFLLTGNGDAKSFQSWYVDPATSVLNAPDVTVKVWTTVGKQPRVLAAFQDYAPVTSALWAEHSGDTLALQGSIDAEAARAKAAEAAISASDAAETTARQAADSQLASLIAAEAAARQAADASINAALAAEVARAIAAEAAVTGAVSAEVSRALAAEGQLSTALAAETTARQQGDTDTLSSAKSYTDTQVAAEAALRSGADATESAARSAADSALQNGLNAETARATGAEAVLQAEIDGFTGNGNALAQANAYTDAQVAAETAARKQGDIDALSAAKAYTDTQVAAEAALRSAADAALQSALNAEAASRTAGDAALTNALNAEQAARIAGDAAALSMAEAYTDGKLGGLAGMLNGAIAGLQTQITSLSSATITVNASQGLSGGAAVPLGGTVNLGLTLAGDVTGAGNAATVARLQGRNVASTAPVDGQVLVWNAAQTRWEPGSAGAAGIPSCGGANDGPSCAASANLGQIGFGGVVNLAGQLPNGGSNETWYTVNFANSGASYHPHVSVGGADYVVDVFNGCGGAFLSCGEGGGSIGTTNWEVNQTAGDPGTGSGTFVWAAPAPGTQLWVRVRKITQNLACNNFSLQIING